MNKKVKALFDDKNAMEVLKSAFELKVKEDYEAAVAVDDYELVKSCTGENGIDAESLLCKLLQKEIAKTWLNEYNNKQFKHGN